jgi:hypothetical protein
VNRSLLLSLVGSERNSLQIFGGKSLVLDKATLCRVWPYGQESDHSAISTVFNK